MLSGVRQERRRLLDEVRMGSAAVTGVGAVVDQLKMLALLQAFAAWWARIFCGASMC